MIYELKTWPEQFEAIRLGLKTCEVRRADRPFAVGDLLQLREWDPQAPTPNWVGPTGPAGDFTGRAEQVQVTHILCGPWGADPTLVPLGVSVLSIRRVVTPRDEALIHQLENLVSSRTLALPGRHLDTEHVAEAARRLRELVEENRLHVASIKFLEGKSRE